MNRQWTTMKNMIGGGRKRNLFLSLINADGDILSANANMVKELELASPKVVKSNFFKLIHPANLDDFKKAINSSIENKSAFSTEIYLKNGHYHPMKWEVNYLNDYKNDHSHFLCIGYELLNKERFTQFNELGEKNYQVIVEGLNSGIFFQDSQGEIIAANKKAAEIFCTSLESLYKLRNIKARWNKSWKMRTEEGKPLSFEETPFMNALRTGKSQNETIIIQMNTGEDRWVHFNSQPLFETDKSEPYSVVSDITDVTREKKLCLELQERDALLMSFMDKTPNLAWVVDEKESLVFASHSFYDYFVLDKEESINKKITDLVPKAVADALYEKHTMVLESGVPVETVEKVKWADGTNFVFHINIFPIEAGTGKKLVGGHAVNLADKYLIEKQLREANDRLLNFTRAANNAIWEWDMQTGQIFRNESLLDMIGYPIEATKGLSWWLRRIHPEDRNRLSDKVKETTENNQLSWEDEYRFKCADGSYKHIHDRGFIVYENGLPVKMIGSLQDVTALKELKDQLMEEKLERQKEISETVIRVQEKERTRIGHELHDNINQILSTTKLFVEMLKPSTKKGKDIKQKSIEYLLTAVEEIRKLSKELVVPELKEKSLVESIRKMVDDINLSDVTRIKFAHDTECDLLSPGKKVTLFRIVQEQLKNILKYSKATEVDIYLDCRDDEAKLMIRDNGIGFDSRHTHRGIGLSNIYDRTRFYNGAVEIETAPGEGCKLTVTIPIP